MVDQGKWRRNCSSAPPPTVRQEWSGVQKLIAAWGARSASSLAPGLDVEPLDRRLGITSRTRRRRVSHPRYCRIRPAWRLADMKGAGSVLSIFSTAPGHRVAVAALQRAECRQRHRHPALATCAAIPHPSPCADDADLFDFAGHHGRSSTVACPARRRCWLARAYLPPVREPEFRRPTNRAGRRRRVNTSAMAPPSMFERLVADAQVADGAMAWLAKPRSVRPRPCRRRWGRRGPGACAMIQSAPAPSPPGAQPEMATSGSRPMPAPAGRGAGRTPRGEQHRGRPVGQRRGSAGGDRAIEKPGFSPASPSALVPGRMQPSASTSPSLVWIRHDFGGEGGRPACQRPWRGWKPPAPAPAG